MVGVHISGTNIKINMYTYLATCDNGRKNGGPSLNDNSPTSAKFRNGVLVLAQRDRAQLSCI